MTLLSLNINKIATLRNSRGTDLPNLLEVVQKLLSFGVKGITLHPRPDGRHILYSDVRDVKKILQDKPHIELNVEGWPSPEFLELMQEVKPNQCTLVPDGPSVLTSNAGWKLEENQDFLKSVLKILKNFGIRTSLFLDPHTLTEKELNFIKKLAPDRAELYTESYAAAYSSSQKEVVTEVYALAARKLEERGIELNAGHDLNSENLAYFLEKVTPIKEVSIGHALICEALYEGLESVVKKYLRICGR